MAIKKVTAKKATVKKPVLKKAQKGQSTNSGNKPLKISDKEGYDYEIDTTGYAKEKNNYFPYRKPYPGVKGVFDRNEMNRIMSSPSVKNMINKEKVKANEIKVKENKEKVEVNRKKVEANAAKYKKGGSTPAWTRSEGKNPTGGLNAKGVASYRAANPGSKLKTAVTTKPSKLKPGSTAANRRKSFCSRMSGHKKKNTSAKTANDPNSRINKALRKWNC